MITFNDSQAHLQPPKLNGSSITKVLCKFPTEATYSERLFNFTSNSLEFYGIHDGIHIKSVQLGGCSIQITESVIKLSRGKTITRQPLTVIDEKYQPLAIVAVDAKKIVMWAREIAARNRLPVTKTNIVNSTKMKLPNFIPGGIKKRNRSNTLPSEDSTTQTHDSRARKISDASFASISTGYIDLCGSTKLSSSAGTVVDLNDFDDDHSLDGTITESNKGKSRSVKSKSSQNLLSTASDINVKKVCKKKNSIWNG